MNRTSILLAALLALAGCTEPTAHGPDSSVGAQTATESALERQTPASGADALPVNESRVYDRVAASLDSDVPQPEVRTVSVDELGGSVSVTV